MGKSKAPKVACLVLSKKQLRWLMRPCEQSEIAVYWEQHLRKYDPVWKSEITVQRWASLFPPGTQLHSPHCAPDHVFPQLVEKGGLYRRYSWRDKQSLLQWQFRDVECGEAVRSELEQGHDANAIPAFIYVPFRWECENAYRCGWETVVYEFRGSNWADCVSCVKRSESQCGALSKGADVYQDVPSTTTGAADPEATQSSSPTQSEATAPVVGSEGDVPELHAWSGKQVTQAAAVLPVSTHASTPSRLPTDVAVKEAEINETISVGSESDSESDLSSLADGEGWIEKPVDGVNADCQLPTRTTRSSARSAQSLGRQLLPAEEQIVAEHLAPRASFKPRLHRSTLLSLHQAVINKASLSRLDPRSTDQWLNDELINCYAIMLETRSIAPNHHGPNVICMSTYLYPLLALPRANQNPHERFVGSAAIFSTDMLFVPVHLPGHWALLAAHIRSQTLYCYDSMSSRNTNAMAKAAKIISKWLSYEYQLAHDQEMSQPWTCISPPNTPQQLGKNDCGVFVCQSMKALSEGKDVLTSDWDVRAEDMPYWRRMMVYEVVSGRLYVDHEGM